MTRLEAEKETQTHLQVNNPSQLPTSIVDKYYL